MEPGEPAPPKDFSTGNEGNVACLCCLLGVGEGEEEGEGEGEQLVEGEIWRGRCKRRGRGNQLFPSPLQVVVFGSDDYTAALGGTRTKSAAEVLYARQHLVTVATAYSLQAIDMVHINYKG